MERAELIDCLRETGCAIERDGIFFLAGNASAVEQEEVRRQMAAAPRGNRDAGAGWLCVRTGGSGGSVKFARHDERTLGAAVRGFCAHFGITQVNAIDVLPAHHVSGLMARVRCGATGGRHLPWDWKRLEAGETPLVQGDESVLSLVPTQLQRLLAMSGTTTWLRRLRIIFVGGGPMWPQLADAAAAAKLRVSLTYGMTETAAMITALQPEEFLAGARSSGAIMPHARVSIDASNGAIQIGGESIHRGYWPDFSASREFLTADAGRFDERGHLHVLGRCDAVIISGGKKIQPEEVEVALRASEQFSDVAVVGMPDEEWGEIVVACYPKDGSPAPDWKIVDDVLHRRLSRHQHPKRFIALAEWPRTALGKVNRAVLRTAVMSTAPRTSPAV